MAISEISKLDGRLLRTSFDLRILGRLIKSKALFLKIQLHLYIGKDFSMVSLGSLNNLVLVTSRTIKYDWL